MSEYLEKEKQKKIQSVFELSDLLLELAYKIKDLKDQESKLKEEVRGLMIELDCKYFEDERLTIKLQRPFSFDFGWFKMNYSDMAKSIVKQKIITKTVDYMEKQDEKLLREKYPGAYQDCLVEMTPRLTIKEKEVKENE